MSGMPPRALLAVPGALATPTGGYGYARRLLAEAHGAGLILRHWPLPGGFPAAPPAVLAATAERLAMLPAGWPVIVDGLALGALPAEMLPAATPVIALCHHPLGLESGLDPAAAARLVTSETAALAACAHVLTTSHATAAILAERFGVAPGRITVAPPGTDPAPQAGGSGGPGVALLAVGSLTPRKGHDVLIDALAGLADLDWHLTVVGPAPDPALAAALAGRAEAAGLAGRIRFAGPLEPGALAAAYAAADLFVLASRYEGYGMAYAEAMAHGLPVVGCSVGAVAEATRGAACLVPPDDAPALAAALRPLIADPAARAALPRWPDTAAIIAGAVAGVMAAA